MFFFVSTFDFTVLEYKTHLFEVHLPNSNSYRRIRKINQITIVWVWLIELNVRMQFDLDSIDILKAKYSHSIITSIKLVIKSTCFFCCHIHMNINNIEFHSNSRNRQRVFEIDLWSKIFRRISITYAYRINWFFITIFI